MAAESLSMSNRRYEDFREPMLEWNEETERYEDMGKTVDENGITIYENEYGSLLSTICRFDDVAILSRYLANASRIVLGPGGSPQPTYDAFWTAAACGSTNALRMLLEH
jgi:hypothetical protein